MNPIDKAVPYYPHDNIVCDHSCAFVTSPSPFFQIWRNTSIARQSVSLIPIPPRVMVVQTWSCNFVLLVVCFVRQLAISLHAFLCMTFHTIGPWTDVCVLQRSWIQTYFCKCSQKMPFAHYNVTSETTAASASGIFIASSIRINVRTRLQWFIELFPLTAIWSSWRLWRVPSIRFLVDSSASTMHAHFVLQWSKTPQVSLYSSRLVVQGIAAGIGTSNFLRTFLIISLN